MENEKIVVEISKLKPCAYCGGNAHLESAHVEKDGTAKTAYVCTECQGVSFYG